VKGFGISGFVGLVELEIVHLERDRVTGYWILADMMYSYRRACITVRYGTAVHTTHRLLIEIQC
jgi:hypothetical protein